MYLTSEHFGFWPCDLESFRADIFPDICIYQVFVFAFSSHIYS